MVSGTLDAARRVFSICRQRPLAASARSAYGLDPTFQQFQLVGEIEKRHELWGQPGKIKITGFLNRGSAGPFPDAVALAAVTGQPANINAVRTYTSRPGVSMNLEQQMTDRIGVFARAGWADGNVEPWDFTDIDRTVEAGVSISGKSGAGLTIRSALPGIVNGISHEYIAFLNAGGLGILVGDGQLPNPGLEKIFEAYYSYALTPASRLTLDYQFVANPGYNADRGPVNAFAARSTGSLESLFVWNESKHGSEYSI